MVTRTTMRPRIRAGNPGRGGLVFLLILLIWNCMAREAKEELEVGSEATDSGSEPSESGMEESEEETGRKSAKVLMAEMRGELQAEVQKLRAADVFVANDKGLSVSLLLGARARGYEAGVEVLRAAGGAHEGDAAALPAPSALSS